MGMRPLKYRKFPLFGKESPRRGEPLDRFLKLLGAFIRLTILHYGVIAEKPRIGQLGQTFPCTL